MREAEKKILTCLQRGVDITSRPFTGFDLPEAEVLALLTRSLDEGLIRRFGGIFDSRYLGYKSILCALDVAPEQLEEKAAMISAHPGVTHCYERTPVHSETRYPNLWFTLAMPQDEFDAGWKTLCIQVETGTSKLFQLPALRRFKIDVVFDLQSVTRNQCSSGNGIVPEITPSGLSEEERALVRAIDQQVPIVEQPFAVVAEQIGQSEEWVLSTLQSWRERGVLRRVGAVLYHREAGFKANAMCVWPVAEEDLLRAGSCVAARPEVTHCYQRPRLDVFPFDLYAMIHTSSWAGTETLFKNISESYGLTGGELFASGREFKKSSMKYFRDVILQPGG